VKKQDLWVVKDMVCHSFIPFFIFHTSIYR
jgi:hypothetical protein